MRAAVFRTLLMVAAVRSVISSSQLRSTINDMDRSTAKPLLTLWINLDRSVLRRKRVQEMFDDIDRKFQRALNPRRISAVDVAKVDELVLAGRLTTTGTTLLDKFSVDTPNWRHHFKGQYVKTEAGCTLSHLSAIKEAYDLGEDIALVIEDDAVVSEKFVKHWGAYVALAPKDWQIIQLYSNNEAVMKQTSRIEDDGFIPWMADHYGTAAYLINRAGMKALLDLSYSKASSWTFPDRVVVADEILYYFTTTYTALDPMIYIVGESSTIQKDTSDELKRRVQMSVQAYMSKLSKPYIQHKVLDSSAPSMMVITTTKLNHFNETQQAIDLFFTNVGVISRHVKVRYELLVLLRTESLRQPAIDAIRPHLSMYGDKTSIHFKIQHHRFNKFRFVRTHIPNMEYYDYILLIDSDLLFEGYPWAEFFKRQKAAKSVVTGSARESKREGLISNLHPGVRQWFRVFDGSWWKQPLNSDVNFTYTDFLEQYFAVLDGRFAQWYFSRVLTDTVMYLETGEPSESDFGPDVMWCGAAQEWLDSSFSITKYRYEHPCALVPLVIFHADTRQIAVSGGEMDKAHLRKQVSMFPVWTNYSHKFRTVLGGTRWNDVNMSTILYQYSGYSLKSLAALDVLPHKKYRVRKRKRMNTSAAENPNISKKDKSTVGAGSSRRFARAGSAPAFFKVKRRNEITIRSFNGRRTVKALNKIK